MREKAGTLLRHAPWSTAINAHFDDLVGDRERHKKRLADSSMEDIQNEVKQTNQRGKLSAKRVMHRRVEIELGPTSDDDQQLINTGDTSLGWS